MHKLGMRKTQFDWDKWWTETYDKVSHVIESGELNLSRIIFYADFMHLISIPGIPEKPRKTNKYIQDQQILTHNNYSYEAIAQGVQCARIQEIVNTCDKNTERIIELGSGYGKNLFLLELNGAPREVEYHAYEFSPKARDLTKKIKDTTTFSKLRIKNFDYYNADFSNLDNKPTVVFTNYSIEGIPQIDPALIEKISNIPGFQKCIHIEPIGWQIKDTSWLDRKNEIFNLKNKIICKKIDFNTKRSYSAWANTNLYTVLKEMQKDGAIKILKIIKNFNGKSLDTPGTVITWEKTRESRA